MYAMCLAPNEAPRATVNLFLSQLFEENGTFEAITAKLTRECSNNFNCDDDVELIPLLEQSDITNVICIRSLSTFLSVYS